jgi:hypothetical protein
MEHDIAKLERRLRTHDERIQSFESLSGLLNPIIHRGGWTTIAEWAFVNLALEVMEQQLEVVANLRTQLVEVAQSVGQ